MEKQRYEILDKIDAIWEDCQKNNIGSNEAELEFKENIADWILKLQNELITK